MEQERIPLQSLSVRLWVKPRVLANSIDCCDQNAQTHHSLRFIRFQLV